MDPRRGFQGSESDLEELIAAVGYQPFTPVPYSAAANNLHDSGAASFRSQCHSPATWATGGYQQFSPKPTTAAANNRHDCGAASFPTQHPNSAISATGGYQAFSPPPNGNQNHRLHSDAASLPTGNHHPDIWATGGYEPFSPKPETSTFFAGNNRDHLTTASFLDGDHHQTNAAAWAAAADMLPNHGFIPTASQINAAAIPRYTDNTALESHLSALRLTHTPRAAPSPYDDINYSMPTDFFHPGSELRDLQQMRIQSAAHQLGLSYSYPQINPDFDQSLENSYGLGAERFFNPSPNYYNSNPNYSGANGSFLNRCLPRVGIKKNRWSYTSVQELRGNIFLTSKDQNGCRFLQRKLQEGCPDDVDMIFFELKDHICELMVTQSVNLDVFLGACSYHQITQLLLKVIHDEHRFKDICVHPRGTKSVQSLLGVLRSPEQRCYAISVLSRITLPLTKSIDGHHVISFCLKHYSLKDNVHIFNEVADNCIEIALDRSGCCVLQECIANSTGELRGRFIAEITANALRLSDHPFGNYVVQYIVTLGIPRVAADVFAQISGHIVSLSMSKYGSNVVEKFLKGKEVLSTFVDLIIEEIVSSPDLVRFLQDPFGNFVAQSAYAASEGEMRCAMVKVIQENYASLHSHPNGKCVLSCLKGKRRR